MKRLSLLILALCLPLTANAYKVGDSVEPAVLSKIGAAAGKVSVVDFFAEWCASCRKELPLISAIQPQLNPQKVEVIGVDVSEDPVLAQAFQQALRAKKHLEFRVVNDAEQQLVSKFRPLGFPARYFIKDGKVVGKHIGAQSDVDARIVRELSALGAV